jgi:hypothetical protein
MEDGTCPSCRAKSFSPRTQPSASDKPLLAANKTSALPPPPVLAPMSSPALGNFYDDYDKVPWYRKSGINSLLILLNLLSFGFFPGVFFVCICVLTGDIYYKEKGEHGLKTWGWGNKIAAVVFLIIDIIYLFSVFSGMKL